MDTGQPDAAHQRDRARDHGRPQDRQGARRRLRRRGDRHGPTRRTAKVVVRRRLDARVGAAAAALEVRRAPERHRQLERPRRPQLLRARDGAGRDRAGQGPASASRARSTTAGRAASTCRASATSRTSIRTSSAATASRAAPAPGCSRATRSETPGFGAAYKKTVRDYAGAFISMGGFGEVLAALREPGRARPRA